MHNNALLAQYRAYIAAGQFGDAANLALEAEATMPASENVWRTLYEFFTELSSAVWADIMTKRFLEVEPNNVPARITRARYFSTIPSKQPEAIQQLDLVVVSSVTRTSDFMEMAAIFGKSGLPDRAFDSLKAASNLDPNDIGIRVTIVHHFINIGAKRLAKKGILEIRDRASSNVGILCTAVDLALRLEDRALVRAIFKQTIQLAAPGEHSYTGQLIVIAAKSKQFKHLANLMTSTDFTKMESVADLAAIYTAIEGRGFFEQERSIVARGLVLQPDNAVLTAAANRQDLPIAKVFQAPRAVTPPRGLGLFRLHWAGSAPLRSGVNAEARGLCQPVGVSLRRIGERT